MDYTAVRYSVKNASLAENRVLIARVFEELDRAAPQTLRYLVLMEEGEFIHVVGASGEREASPLSRLNALKAFTGRHEERRSTPVMRSSARIIGNYRVLAAAEPST